MDLTQRRGAESRREGALWRRGISWLFAREAGIETVSTRVHFDLTPEAVWDLILFYEEIPGRPPLLLRTLLPAPLRTEGRKTGVGAEIRCIYQGGDLRKRVTAMKPPYLIRFDVLDQRLGIEDWTRALEGAYRIEPEAGGADLVLTTRYAASLHPRFLWRPIEKLVAGQLHHHVLRGMRHFEGRAAREEPMRMDYATASAKAEGKR
jgi:hypothetical protein